MCSGVGVGDRMRRIVVSVTVILEKTVGDTWIAKGLSCHFCGVGVGVQLCVQVWGVGNRMRKIAVYKYNWGIKLAIHDISQNSDKAIM